MESTSTPTPMWWGVTMSSLQAEGVAAAADWSRWEREHRAPVSGEGSGFATDYANDFEAFASLGLTHVRMTLEWARLEPLPGRVDADAFDRYEDILVAARRNGLSIIATLAHGTLPGWFADDTPGFRDEQRRHTDWSRHVDRCAERFDSLVAMWVPFDDPIGWAIRGHLLGSRPPGRRDPELAMAAAEGALLAVGDAARLLSSGDTPVMGTFGTPTVFGIGPDSGGWRRWWRDLLYTSWMGAFTDGELRVPGRPPVLVDDITSGLDVIGLNHDHPIGVNSAGRICPYPVEGPRTDAGFTPVPNELAELLSFVAAELPGTPLAISGHGVPTADDEWREEILKETVRVLDGARVDGLDVIGYLHDTGVDGYEGPYGFNSQRGLLTRSRDPKDSATWLAEHLARGNET